MNHGASWVKAAMFKQLSNVAQMMKHAQAMQGRLQEVKDDLARIQVIGSAGGGLVEVEATGDQRILAVRLSESARTGDPRQLEELVGLAVNDALDRARLVAAESMQSLAGGLPGMGDILSQFGSGK